MNEEESTPNAPNMSCEEVRDLLYLYSCGELSPEEHEAVSLHLLTCAGCRVALEEHGVLKRALPSGFVDRKLFYYSRDN